jgi:hypothetical protein
MNQLSEQDAYALMQSESGRKKYSRFVLATLSVIPWVGGFLAACAAFDAEAEQGKVNQMQKDWIDEHKRKIADLAGLVSDITARLDDLGERVESRISDESFLQITRKSFQNYDQATSESRITAIRNIIVNAAGTDLCDDRVVMLFAEWINVYSDFHFDVIGHVFNNPGATRGQIWNATAGQRPAENSAEADLFKLLVRDLSTGGVIRQHRPTDYAGNFIKQSRRPKGSGGTYKSAFDDTEPYELTELGRQFVHYVLTDSVKSIENNNI